MQLCTGVILELQGWTDGMDSDSVLTLFIGGMTLIWAPLEVFIGYCQIIASLIVYAIKTIMQIVYITGMYMCSLCSLTESSKICTGRRKCLAYE